MRRSVIAYLDRTTSDDSSSEYDEGRESLSMFSLACLSAVRYFVAIN
jgi:hypothetical protein